MKDGIIVLNKPRNWTSHDCVAVVRRAVGVKRVGHGGTLDPMAEGVLPVFIGKAARITEYLDGDEKTYLCTVRLGMTTDTQDIWGQTLTLGDPSGVTMADVIEALDNFRGEISQIPPKYSALKVNGRKLYEYAREGKAVEIKARKVFIHQIKMLSSEFERPDDPDFAKMVQFRFQVTCSKGTYIRTLCQDLGEILGCGGTMAALTRVQSGVFDLKDAVSPEKLKTMEASEIEALIQPADKALWGLGILQLPEDRAAYFCRGNSIWWNQVQVKKDPSLGDNYRNGRGIGFDRIYRVYRMETGEFLGTGYWDQQGNLLKADKIFAP